MPLSIGFSIFRYGLWEIDFIINRTLVYGLLMALLAAAWKLSTKLLESLFNLYEVCSSTGSNLISLFGYSDETPKIVVYEFRRRRTGCGFYDLRLNSCFNSGF